MIQDFTAVAFPWIALDMAIAFYLSSKSKAEIIKRKKLKHIKKASIR